MLTIEAYGSWMYNYMCN